MRALSLVLAWLLSLGLAWRSSAQIDSDFDDCGGRAAVVDVRWDLLDADPATELGVASGFRANGDWHLNARPGDLVRAWLFVRSCDGVLGVRATGYWYDYLLDMVSWEPGPHVANVRQAPFRYATFNGGRERGGFSQWQLTYDFTHESPTGAPRRLAPGEVLDLGFLTFRVTGVNDDGGLYRVYAWNQSGYTYDYKLVGDSGTLYTNRQGSTRVRLLDPAAFLPAGEFPLFGAGSPPPPPTAAPVCSADIDGDGKVARPDLKIMADHWGQCVGADGVYRACP